MSTFLALDAVVFFAIAAATWAVRGRFEPRPCVRVEQPCACANRRRDERGRFVRQ